MKNRNANRLSQVLVVLLVAGVVIPLGGCSTTDSQLSKEEQEAFSAKDRPIPADVQAKIAAGQAGIQAKMQEGAAKGGASATATGTPPAAK